VASTSPANFESFYAAYAPLVRRILVRSGVSQPDLDDVVQETFVTVHRLLPEFEGRSSLQTWLHSVAWRVAANHRRRARRSGPKVLPVVPDESPEPWLNVDRYQASFDRIDGENRDLLALHEIGGLSISYIAELTGNARATVRRKLERGRAALMRAIADRSASEAHGTWPESLIARFEQPVPVVSAPELRVLPCRQTCVSTIDDVVIVVWRGSANEALPEVIGTLFTHARVWPDGVRYLAVIEPTSTPPNRESRDMTVWAARALGHKLKAAASLVEGSARITALASVMNTLYFLARARFDAHYFGELAPALTWLAQHGAVDAAQTREQIARMKQQLDPPRRE
jgi:RNA polymerase sigma-70 factor (ECF subfamily)